MSIASTPIRLGLITANIGPTTDGPAAVGLATLAEQLGMDSLWAGEHIVIPAGQKSPYPYSPDGQIPGGDDIDIPDPLIWLSYVAAATSTIKLGTGVIILPLRNPLILAKEVASLDRLSGGRVLLGVGVGWLAEEFELLEVPFTQRGRRHDDYITALRALWSQDIASVQTTHARFSNAISKPKPTTRTVPIVISGGSDAAARRAGRLGDGYFPSTTDPHRLTQLLKLMRMASDQAGRDPSAIELTVALFDTDPDTLSTHIEGLLPLGIERVLLSPMPPETLNDVVDSLTERFNIHHPPAVDRRGEIRRRCGALH
ncbi:MAG TPA: LLM class F420-dependent oxidoreductase [Candidatus Dormibacteraeota bacterium]